MIGEQSSSVILERGFLSKTYSKRITYGMTSYAIGMQRDYNTGEANHIKKSRIGLIVDLTLAEYRKKGKIKIPNPRTQS